MDTDPPVIFAVHLATHKCLDCGALHHLRPHPEPEGWGVVVACTKCRDKMGMTRRYSTELTGLKSLLSAQQRIGRMLRPSTEKLAA